MMQQNSITTVGITEASRQTRRNRDKLCRTADILVDQLIEAGVEVIFGLPGGAVAPIYDALLDPMPIV